MSHIALRVEGLSKQYRIGRKQESYKTLRETIGDAVMSPIHRVGKLLRIQTADMMGLDQTIWALKDVSFEVRRSEVVGIIGRNGAGKSTLLKILSRITGPTEGYVDIYGRVGSLLEVGTGFHPELTGRENIYLNGAILGMKRAEISRKFDEIVAFAEVDKFIDTPVKHYSSGMYLRLAFAVAAHLEPEILLVDEVLAVGDAAFQKKCLGKMGEVAREGRTVLFVSHNLAAIEPLCSRALLLTNGTLALDREAPIVITTYLRTLFEQARTELASRPDRIGNGKGRLISLDIRSNDGDHSVIRCSHRIEVRVRYATDQPLCRCVALLGVIDQRGVPIYWLDSRYDASFPDTLPGSGAIRCVTGPLNLTPGIYSVNAALLINNEIADQIEAAATFTVETDNFFGVGRMPERQYGLFLLAQNWYAEQY